MVQPSLASSEAPALARVARRIRVASLAGPQREATHFDPQQHYLELALRSRSARQVRTWLRRMDPVFVATPRWSRPQGFLEEIALDLAVGEPAIGCRTLGCRPLKNRSPQEAWGFLLQVFGQLGRGGELELAPSTAVERKGFHFGLSQVLEQAHRSSRHRLAVLMHGIEHLPVEVLSDLCDEWRAYSDRHPEGVRVALLLAGAEKPRWLDLPGLREGVLEDYSEAETIAALVYRCGKLPPRQLRLLAAFTGGVPDVVESVVAQLRAQASAPAGAAGRRTDAEALVQGLGALGDEMRGALDIVAAQGDLSDRLSMLASGTVWPEWLDLDAPLIEAGLVKRVRCHGLPHVALRASALSTMLG